MTDRQTAPIRTSEELFRALSANGIDADCLLDSRLRIIYASPSTEHVLGYSVESVLGQNMLQKIVHPDDRRQMLEHLLQVKRNPVETVSMRFRLNHSNVGWRWMRGSARNLLDHPAVNAIACNCYDISEIVEAEEERSRVLEVTRCILWEAEVIDHGDSRLCWNTRIVNPAAARDFLPLEEVGRDSYGEAWYLSRHPEDSVRMDATAADAIRSGKLSYTQEFRCRTRGGATRLMLEDARVEKLEPCRWHVVGVVIDITEREQSEERHRFLARISGILNESLDYQTALQHTSAALVQDFAEWCRIDLLDDSGELELVSLENADPTQHQFDQRMTRTYPPKPGSPHPALIVRETGKSLLIPTVKDELIKALAHDSEHLKLLRSRHLQSIICVPLNARGRLKGTMTLFTQVGGRIFDDADLKLAEEIGRRAAVALDNATLYKKLEQSVAERRRLAEERERVVQSANCILWEADVYEGEREGLPVSSKGLSWDFRISRGKTAQRFIKPAELETTDYKGRWYDCKHPDDRERMEDTSVTAIRSTLPYTQEFHCRTLSGEWRWLHEDVTVMPAKPGQWRLVGVVTDITDERRAAERLKFLARISGILHESLDFKTALQQIASALVPDFADWSRIDLVRDNGDIDVVAIAHADPEQLEHGRQLSSAFPPKPDSLHPVLAVVSSGRPYFAPRVDDEVLKSIAYDDEHLEALRSEKIHSTIFVPLQARGILMGTLGIMTSESERTFDEEDLALAEEIGRRAAVALDNAKLYSQLEHSMADRQKMAEERERVVQSASCILWEADVYNRSVKSMPVSKYGLCWDLRVALGYTAQQYIPPWDLDSTDSEGKWRACKHVDDRERMDEAAATAIHSNQPGYTEEFRCQTLSGEWRWLHEDVIITELGSGHWRLVGVATDITEQRRAADRLRFLARASGILTESLDYQTALQRITNAMVTDFADWARIDMLTPTGDTEVVAIATADFDAHRWGTNAACAYPPKAGSEHPVLTVLRTGRPYFAPTVAPEVLDSVAPNEDHARILRDMQIVSTICVPLQARGQLFGAMMFITTAASGRVFDQSDLELAQEIGRRAGIAIDNARVYGRLERALSERNSLEEERDRVVRSANCILWKAEVWKEERDYSWSFRLMNQELAQRFISSDLSEAEHGRVWDGIKHPEDVPLMAARARYALDSGDLSYTQEFRAKSLDGGWRWLREDVRIDPVGARRWLVVGVCTDVTDARALQEQRDRVMLAANCLLWQAEVEVCNGSDDSRRVITDGDYLWNIRIMNSESARRFLNVEHLEAKEYTGDWYNSKHPDDRAEMDRRAAEAFARGLNGYSQDYRCRTHEGEWRWLHEDVRIERVDEGKWHVVGVCTDITDVKDAEAVLSQTNQQLTALISIITAVSSTLHLEWILQSLAQGLCVTPDMSVSALLISEYAGAPSVQRASWNLPDSDIELIYSRIQNGMALLEQQNSFPDFLEACAVLTQTLNLADSDWQSYLALPLIVHGHFNGVAVLISRDAHVFNQNLVTFYESLAHEVAIAVQNARLFEQIRDANERLQEVSRQLVEVQEEERRQIARDLHDEIGQLLTGLKIQLQLIETGLPGKSQEIAGVSELVTQIMGEVRDMSLRLRPPVLDDFGAGPAITWLAERYCGQTGIRVDLDIQGEVPRIGTMAETAAFRFVQEALTNIARYAGVSSAKVTVRTDDNSLILTVLDSGIGFDVQAVLSAARTAGIGGMRERIALVGGSITVESKKGVGTSVTATIPLNGNH